MSDLVSRADAIALLTKIVFDEPPYLDSETLCRSYAEEQINALPSAEAEWIPCSERLPSEDGLYLIQTNYMYHGIPNMEVYYWAEGWNCIRLLNGIVEREYEIDGIVAWMPLPKPYKAESEEV